VNLPSVESTTPPEQVSGTTHDGLEISGLAADQDEVAMAAPISVLPVFELMDARAAGEAAKMVPAEDPPIAPQVSREEKIAALLAQGRLSLSQFRLLTPPEDNANHYFTEVLVLDPGNIDARERFNLIAERYVLLARSANKHHDSKLARVYIARGLEIRPNNRDLLALQNSMRKTPATARKTMAKAPPAAGQQPQQASFFSRLKLVFTWKREEPAPVVERSIMSVNH
jgi:hypothetical protein